MPSPKEIKKQVVSIKKIQKITDAMQKVAASKMRKTQQKMTASLAYANKIREVVEHVASSNTALNSQYLNGRENIKRIGYIIISTDRGLCGGLNTNLFKKTLEHTKQFCDQGYEIDWCVFGDKIWPLLKSSSANIIAHTSNIGESPSVADIIGNIKIMLDAYVNNEIGQLFIAHNDFVNTMVQKPAIMKLLPPQKKECPIKYQWDYLYEPGPEALLRNLILRYIETQVYQAIVDNIACEQVARMVAMQNATTSANELINDLQLMYNKARQAAITQELAEIISGSSAV